MPRNPPLQVVFPRLGVTRRLGLRPQGRQTEFGTPWAINCRLEDALSGRLRGGSFTGQTTDTFTADHTTETFTATGHAFTDGMRVQLTTATTLPEGLSEETDYYIIAAETDTFQLSATKGGSAAAITSNGTGTHTANPVIAKPDPVYRDRAITFSDNAITAARQGDSTDTDLDADVSDAARPILFQLAVADAVGGNVVAVVPHKDAYLLCFTATETWVLQGDPATGLLRRVSDNVGILGASAWCVKHDTVYFMSDQGLYQVQADGSGLKAVSEDRIPEDLTGIDDSDCILNYYHPDRGVYIHLDKDDEGEDIEPPAWFYDTERDGFWPFDTDTTDSHVLLGPFHLGQGISYGRIQNLQGNMATGSADVTWRIIAADTAEEAAANGKAAIEAAVAGTAYSQYVAASGTFAAGRSHMTYPRTRALFVVLWLWAESGTWAYESVSMTRSQSGRWR